MTTNHLSLSGEIARLKRLKSPSGIPHWVILLEHKSQRYEADMLRNIYLQMKVVLSGERFALIAESLEAGMEVKVDGFISLQTSRNGQQKTVLHAEQVELKT
ncbi:primosomal replication protein N [Parashewanella tropica]|uniref:primosomal replication protein N n=1 Tax=Parashewanella tropica TaxID=2547970 RepID=UPI0010595340|nr:primosomal replication protein N [Parashewanella tropica]